ncbi:MAG: DUF4276 family protein, partial [Deltaproteobacteria bacterium]|nr:DUF4276 family protein [Deltaproteobacteria bacterium]
HGEVAAVPVLLRRLRDEVGVFTVDVLPPIRQTRSQLAQKSSLQRVVQVACLKVQGECATILILFDSDDDCPKERAIEMQQWASEVSRSIPCAVVMAVKEYEAWFLATMESLRGKAGIMDDAVSLDNPELVRGAKEAIERQMMSGFSYKETIDQPALSAIFDMHTAYLKCRSFRKLVKSFGELVLANEAGIQWPPANWM